MTDLKKLGKETSSFPERAKSIIVYSFGTLTKANEFLTSIKLMRKEINTTFNPIIKKAHEAHKEAVAQKKRYDDPLVSAEKIIKIGIAAYMEDMAKIRREEEEKAKREEEVRQKEEDRILAEAKILEDSGKEKEAESLQAEIPLPAQREETPPEPEGLSLKKIVDTEKINKKVNLLMLPFVNSFDGMRQIPGIEVYPVFMWKIVDRKLIPESYYKTTVASRVMTQGKPEDA